MLDPLILLNTSYVSRNGKMRAESVKIWCWQAQVGVGISCLVMGPVFMVDFCWQGSKIKDAQ